MYRPITLENIQNFQKVLCLVYDPHKARRMILIKNDIQVL